MVVRRSRASVTLLLLVLGMACASRAAAAPLPEDSVPDPLKPWVPWVLHGAEERQCPFFYNSDATRQCSWPARLTVSVTNRGGSFALQVTAFRALWVPLPGDDKHWPQQVRVDGQAAPVVAQQGRPGVRLSPGTHAISGAFAWSEVPETLPVPRSIGLVALTSNGTPVAAPNLDSEGRLWLSGRADRGGGTERIEVRTNRLVSDDIPMTVTTHIELVASGKSQEVRLPNVLLRGFVPLSLSSPLPARFEPDGALRVQARSGRWEIVASSRNMTPQSDLQLPRANGGLAAREEVWAFEARAELRLVTPEGVPMVDPQQTTLPQNWKRFPAFLMHPGDTLRLKQTRRGDPEPDPDKLSLNRDIWLDFDGNGYTIQDRIAGSLTRAWRLEMAQPQRLGRAVVGGVDQHITQLDADSAPGIELRHGAADITADSRIDLGVRKLSATGWMHDFNALSATLHLPPGWRLLHAAGADSAPQAWIERWTLLDFFLVLIIALASAKLFDWRWGLVALVAMTLSYHESGAPTWAWLNPLAAAALLRVLPQGRMRRAIDAYRWISVVAVIALLVPFAVDQARQALYPVLEQPWRRLGIPLVGFERDAQLGLVAKARTPEAPPAAAAPAEEPAAPAAQELEQERARSALEMKREKPRSGRYDVSSSADVPAKALDQIDPDARIQTGPGLPHWRWHEYALQWSGPVQRDQTLRLWLVSPGAEKLLTVGRLALLIALLVRLASQTLPRLRWRGRPQGAAALLAAFMLSGVLHSEGVQAQALPSPELLEQLRGKLLAPPDCLPRCAEISRLRLSATPGELQLRLEVHAHAQTAVPLPGGAQHWLPDRVIVDGAPAHALLRDGAGTLWVQLASGVHQIAMESRVAGRHNIQLALPLKPHRVEASLAGWTLDGLGEGGEAGESLLLTRAAGAGRQARAATGDSLPPFVRVERTLNLGLVWQVATRVVRVGPSQAPVLVQIPLLAGESVTHGEVRVRDATAMVNLGPQTKDFYFESALKENARILLEAPAHANEITSWRLNLGPQWHATLSGIPVVHHQDGGGRWLPEWRPWPGEQVTLALTRPAGIPGQTLTLDRSLLALSPGLRATDAELLLSLRSSRGGQHVVQLPKGAVLQSVAIDGQTQPIRLQGEAIDLPVHPGKQEVQIVWREPRGMTTNFVTSPVDVGTPGVNGALHVKMPEGRWLLLVGGPPIGPAILFWGVLVVVTLAAVALGRIGLTPLRWHHWLLLGLGLTQATLLTAGIVVGWFIALGARRRFGEAIGSNWWFNLGQIVLAIWSAAAMISLFSAVETGLLGYPEMQVAGNGSDLWNLRWYQDRTRALLPSAWAVSVPLMVYRLLMLAWALWLAYALLHWLRWAWASYSDHGYWRRLDLWKRLAGRRKRAGEAGAA